MESISVKSTLQNYSRRFGTLSFIVAVALTGNLFLVKNAAHAAPIPNELMSEAARTPYGNLPTTFIANAGQLDANVRYEVRSSAGHLFFTPQGVTLALTTVANAPAVAQHIKSAIDAPPPTSIAVSVSFDGANPNPILGGADQLPGIANFFIGNDSTQWHTNVPTYAGIVYRDLYPGIDLSYTGHVGVLKGTYTVAPGADPSLIQWRYIGANGTHIDATMGNLLINAPEGVMLTEQVPEAWQVGADGGRHTIVTHYMLAEDGALQFTVGEYDHVLPLVIDPGLIYSTYLGGSAYDQGYGIAVDSSGSAYITGASTASSFPITAGAYQTAFGGANSDAFVSKLNATGSALVYSTYLGGNGYDQSNGIVVDSNGSAYVTGYTDSTNFPTTAGAYQTTFGGGKLAVFVTKLNTVGSALVYSTYLSGSGNDNSYGIALDNSGNAYVTGSASAGFPTTAGAYQTTFGGGGQAFVTKLNASGSALVYSTYVGGSGGSGSNGIAVDSSGSAYITGSAGVGFPTTAGAFQTTYSGVAGDAFVSKLNASGSALVYSTYMAADLKCRGIALDSNGNTYVTGYYIPMQSNAETFVFKLNTIGSALDYFKFLSSSTSNYGYGIAVDNSGSAYIIGSTSDTFPTTAGAYQTTFGGFVDIFVTKLNPAGNALVYSTYLGGSGADQGNAIALDSGGNAYVTGYTNGSFPTTTGAYQTAYGGSNSDVFVTKLDMIPIPPTTTPTNSTTPTLTPSVTNTFTLTVTASSTATPTFTPSATSTSTATPTLTPSATTTSSLTATATASYTLTRTVTTTVTPSPTMTNTAKATFTSSAAVTATIVVSATATPTNTPSTRKPDTIGVFRPSTATFYLRGSNTQGFADLTVQYGNSNSYPVVGDWTGGGVSTIGVFDPTNGQFQLRNSNTPGVADETFVLGIAGDQPFAGRWQAGAAHDGVGVFRPSNGLIYLKNDLGSGFADYTMVLGIPGDVGVAGDWDGNGVSSPGVFRPNIVTFYLSDQVVNGSVFGDHAVTLGYPGDTPFAGDWIGQGHAGIGVFRPTNGLLYLKNDLSSGFADVNIVYGIPNDIPVAGHWGISSAPTPHNSVIVPNTPLPATATTTPTQPALRLTQPSSYDG